MHNFRLSRLKALNSEVNVWNNFPWKEWFQICEKVRIQIRRALLSFLFCPPTPPPPLILQVLLKSDSVDWLTWIQGTKTRFVDLVENGVSLCTPQSDEFVLQFCPGIIRVVARAATDRVQGRWERALQIDQWQLTCLVGRVQEISVNLVLKCQNIDIQICATRHKDGWVKLDVEVWWVDGFIDKILLE